jgi:hypothetical protein
MYSLVVDYLDETHTQILEFMNYRFSILVLTRNYFLIIGFPDRQADSNRLVVE